MRPINTELTQAIEARHGKPLARVLVDTLNAHECRIQETAAALGVTKGALCYWMLRLGVKIKTVYEVPDATA